MWHIGFHNVIFPIFNVLQFIADLFGDDCYDNLPKTTPKIFLVDVYWRITTIDNTTSTTNKDDCVKSSETNK